MDDFHVTLCTKIGVELEYTSVKKFTNDLSGYKEFLKWIYAEAGRKSEIHFLMEATGVYHQKLAYFLFGKSKLVYVVLPNMSKHFFESLNVKSKTDALDAKVLSRFGAERKLSPWQPPKEIFKRLKDLCRYKTQLKRQKAALMNIGHSKEYSANIPKTITRANNKLVKIIAEEICKIEAEIEKVVASDLVIQEKVKKICTIKGCQLPTVASIIAETNGFEHFNSMKQLASFAGYDVVQHQSGTSVLKKGKMSKKGNSYIRASLYLPAISASKHCPELRNTYQRLLQKHHIKMKAQVAIQRKLLLLIYTLWKNDTEYIPNYYKRRE